jgi:hypothetical protein
VSSFCNFAKLDGWQRWSSGISSKQMPIFTPLLFFANIENMSYDLNVCPKWHQILV